MRRVLSLLSLILLISCGSNSSPTGPGSDSGATILPPAPEGMLLPGDAADDATGATVNLAPSPVGADQMLGRLLTTRLAAVVAPGATIGDVNRALEDRDAAIVSMVANSPAMTLVIPAVAGRAEADALAADLIASGAFAHVRPGFSAVKGFEAMAVARKDLPQADVASRTPQALPMRLPAAWNLRAAATDVAALVHPNWYADVPGYIEIPQLSFAGFGEHVPVTAGPEYAAGSIGYYMLGVAAANWEYDPDFSPHTGTDGAAAEALSVIGVDTYGLDASEVIAMTALALPDSPPRVVLLDTETFDDPELESYRFIDRAWLALQWRGLVFNATAIGGPAFLHVVAAGETRHQGDPYDDAILNSVAGVSTLSDLRAVAFLDASEEEYAGFTAGYQAAVARQAHVAEPLTNVLIVGSSDTAGNESSFSAPGSDVRVVGEGVVGPCLVGDQCDGVSTSLNSTSAAAAQVAGLGAYLWHLDGSLSLDDLLLRLQHAYSASGHPGILDASIAALSVERSGGNANLRELLLDVDGPNGEPDGVFTEHDLQKFLTAFDAFDGAVEPDWSVYDLNGDGWTAGRGRARMDLDVNDLPSFSVVTQDLGGVPVEFDETAVTDREVLCYYAWSSLYTGDPDVRDELLPDCSGRSSEVLAGSKSWSAFRLDVESDSSGEYADGLGEDRIVFDAFGDHVTAVDSTIAMGGLSATSVAHTSATLYQEPGGTVTLAVDLLTTSRTQWPALDDYASALAVTGLDIGLELTGEFTLSVSGRLEVNAPGSETDGAIYAHVGPDSTLRGWSIPGGAVWRLGGSRVESEVQDMDVGAVTIPAGTHRIWLNLRGDCSAGDDSRAIVSGSTGSDTTVEDLLIVLTPTVPEQSSVRVLAGADRRRVWSPK